ncbi:N-acetylglucosamine-6-phosphate deacetylase [Microbacterium panaciterrae]|uniref:N-acetylglucosamine-6-phosphate deacetylase n=1 Tax=Microbacterium panaciterrae TaxID=985759 RepID=A0ABP8P021_9MICO
MSTPETSAHGSIVIHSARIVSGGAIVEDGWVRFEEGLIAGRGTGSSWGAADVVIDAAETAGAGAILTPGFVDIHGHGGAGTAFDDGAEAIRTARAMHRAHGTTRAVVSLITATLDLLADRVAAVADLMQTDHDLLGSHLEGPFLDLGHKGAHDPELLRAPVADEVQRLLEAGRGTVRQVTLAPELDGGLEAIRIVVAAGAAAAVGHTDADDDTLRAAFDAGATILTHAFNAMRPVHHRTPGPVLTAAHDERVTLEAIADNIHLHPQIIKLVFDEAPGRVALITDAMAAAGSADGDYMLGSLHVTVRGGIARVDSGSIAGSTLTQDVALRNAVAAGVPLADAVEALTRTPARAIGVAGQLGLLDEGYLADAVLLSAELDVSGVWTGAALTR